MNSNASYFSCRSSFVFLEVRGLVGGGIVDVGLIRWFVLFLGFLYVLEEEEGSSR